MVSVLPEYELANTALPVGERSWPFYNSLRDTGLRGAIGDSCVGSMHSPGNSRFGQESNTVCDTLDAASISRNLSVNEIYSLNPIQGQAVAAVFGAGSSVEPEADAAAMFQHPPRTTPEDLVMTDLGDIEAADLDSDELLPTGKAKETCIEMARLLGPILRYDTSTRVAAFPGELGGVSLILHSLGQRRRIEAEINAQGGVVRIHSIDETDQLTTTDVTGDGTDQLVEATLWMVGARP